VAEKEKYHYSTTIKIIPNSTLVGSRANQMGSLEWQPKPLPPIFSVLSIYSCLIFEIHKDVILILASILAHRIFILIVLLVRIWHKLQMLVPFNLILIYSLI